jgi:hypothetical protein
VEAERVPLVPVPEGAAAEAVLEPAADEAERGPLVPVPDGAAAEAVLEPAADEADEAEDAGTVAKPELAEAEEGTGAMETTLDAEGAVEALDAGGAAEALAAEGAAEALPPELPELEPDPPPMPLTAAQVPVKVPAPWDVPVTSGPGSGNAMSKTFVSYDSTRKEGEYVPLPSTVVQPLARLATKGPGRAEKAVSRSEIARLEPPPMVTEAQFM